MAVFKVPASKAEAERFEFSIGDGTYSLPNMNHIPVEAGILFAEEKALQAVVASADDEKTRAAVKRLTVEQLSALVEAWGEASGVEAGE